MAIYEYRCDADGAFDVTLPLGTAPTSISCPACESDSPRIYSKPMTTYLPKALVAAVDRAEKSRTEPDVVRSLPSAGARRRTQVLPLTPTLRRLPRP
jgi:putative FmdB family regulatory protein